MDKANVTTILNTINLIEGCGRENVSMTFYIWQMQRNSLCFKNNYRKIDIILKLWINIKYPYITTIILIGNIY